jgi:rhodanese-related sulfurtransferase
MPSKVAFFHETTRQKVMSIHAVINLHLLWLLNGVEDGRRKMDKILYLILLSLVIWILYKQFVPVKGLHVLTPEQFESEAKRNKVIDVREVHEYKRGHIKGAVNIPLSQLPQQIDDIPKNRKVLLYCQSGLRSKQAAKLFVRKGYPNVAELRGGMMSWKGPTQI